MSSLSPFPLHNLTYKASHLCYNISTKKDFSSLPYSKIRAFSIETAGVFDLDSELEIWFSELGKVKFEFVSEANVSKICKIIFEKVL